MNVLQYVLASFEMLITFCKFFVLEDWHFFQKILFDCYTIHIQLRLHTSTALMPMKQFRQVAYGSHIITRLSYWWIY